MFKKQLLVVVSFVLLAAVSEFLWMESLAGKEDVFEIETEYSSQLEEKVAHPDLKVKLQTRGLEAPLVAQIEFTIANSHSTITVAKALNSRAYEGPGLYLLYCQLRQHC